MPSQVPTPSADGAPRSVLMVLVLGLLAYGAIRYALIPVYISDPPPPQGSQAQMLADRIDPNNAEASVLAALPGMGPKLAGAIVEYRETYRRDDRGEYAFQELQDLLRVDGIGYQTAQNLRPYLIFPSSNRPTTRP